MIGTNIRIEPLWGTTDAEKDAACCQLCNAEPTCEFWLLHPVNMQCALKKDFVQYQASSGWRGAHKEEAGDCGDAGLSPASFVTAIGGAANPHEGAPAAVDSNTATYYLTTDDTDTNVPLLACKAVQLSACCLAKV